MSIQFITRSDQQEGTQALAQKISSYVKVGKRVLWLIPGGSNIPIAAEVLGRVRANVSLAELAQLTIALTDERYGPVGHPDSNWKQLQDQLMQTQTGDLHAIGLKDAYPILQGDPLEETVAQYGKTITTILNDIDVIVGQFGMGADGHIAGILPHSPATKEETLPTAGYESKPFTRISLSFPILRKITVAYMFVSNATKKEAIARLHEDNVSLEDQPAQILKAIPEVYVYID